MRCYDGCPDSELQALIDHKAALRKKVTERYGPGARVTYFPMEGAYRVYSADHKPLGVMSPSMDVAVNSALAK